MAAPSRSPDRQKWLGAAAAAIILVAIIVLYRMYASTQVQVEKYVPAPPGSSEKMQEMKAQGGLGANAARIEDSPSDRLGGGTGSPGVKQ